MTVREPGDKEDDSKTDNSLTRNLSREPEQQKLI